MVTRIRPVIEASSFWQATLAVSDRARRTSRDASGQTLMLVCETWKTPGDESKFAAIACDRACRALISGRAGATGPRDQEDLRRSNRQNGFRAAPIPSWRPSMPQYETPGRRWIN